MNIVKDNLWLDQDCMMVAVNGDYSGLDYYLNEEESKKRADDINKGLDKLGPHLVPNFDIETGDGYEEFARKVCDCCGSTLAGTYHRFAILK